MLFKFVFGIGALTISLSLLLIAIGLCDFLKHPDAYKQNIDRQPWLK